MCVYVCIYLISLVSPPSYVLLRSGSSNVPGSENSPPCSPCSFDASL